MSHCEWKPIEEAPRDGTLVILRIEASSDPIGAWWCDAAERWIASCEHYQSTVEISFRNRNVTGWIPLPHPPKERKVDE